MCGGGGGQGGRSRAQGAVEQGGGAGAGGHLQQLDTVRYTSSSRIGLIDYSPKMWVSCPEETTPAKVTLSGPILFLWVDSGYNLKFDIGRGE